MLYDCPDPAAAQIENLPCNQWVPGTPAEYLSSAPRSFHPGGVNVTFADGVAWSRDVSHGELLRDGYDESLTVDTENLRFLYQGVDPAQTNVAYHLLPYRLGLLTAAE